MKNNQCEHCGVLIPINQMLCSRCSAMYIKLGAILQSQEVTKEEAERAHESIKKNCDENTLIVNNL
jgi:hypothetical protein